MLTAALWLAAAWILVLLADATGVWQLSFLAVFAAAYGIGRDISGEGYFHPVMVFSFFSLLIVLIDLGWMATYMYDDVPFFAYEAPVVPGSVNILVGEQLVLFSASYAGYLLVRGTAGRDLEYAAPVRGTGSLWLLVYLFGVLALLSLIVGSGGFAELFSNLGAKYERAENRGGLVLLQYFAYAGILMWYAKNLARPAFLRYGGLVALAFPLLLSGSRTGMLICLVAALYMDERAGNRINLGALVLGGLALAVFFALYQAFRGQGDVEIPLAIYKDLSMGVGYVIAVQEGLIGDRFHLGLLFNAISPFVPGPVDRLLDVPPHPNNVLTQYLFPGTRSTFSVGVMGEANYVFRYGWSFFYYLAVGAALTWIGSFGWKRSLLLASVVAGGAVRIARGGATTGVANILMFAVPLLVVFAVLWIVSAGLKSAAPENP